MPAEIKMYTTTWCGICVHTKRYLKTKNYAFEEIDIEQHPEYGDRIEEATGGFRTVPTLEIGGKLLVNPTRREIDEAVAAQNGTASSDAGAAARATENGAALVGAGEPASASNGEAVAPRAAARKGAARKVPAGKAPARKAAPKKRPAASDAEA